MFENDFRSHPLDFERGRDEEQSIGVVHSQLDSRCHDDDGRPKRTGTIWTTSSHIITAVIGSGVLSLAWAIAQLGWIAGPVAMIFFSFVTVYTSSMLADCYRCEDPEFGRRNYTYKEAVSNILGVCKGKICGIVQYLYLYGSAIGYTIAAAISMRAIHKSDCFRASRGKESCQSSLNPYLIGFGVIQIFCSLIQDFHETWWLSIVAAIMSFSYSIIGFALAIVKVVENGGTFKGRITGVRIGTVTQAQKIWAIFQALGDIAFAYSFAQILIEIQDTIKNPPCEVKTMKKSTKLSIGVTTTFYMLCGCMGYAAFGDAAPGNLLSGFDNFNPFWVIDIANCALIIHLVGAYQVYVQPVYAFVEKAASKRYPIAQMECKIPCPGFQYNLNLFRLIWRTLFVIVTTFIAMLIPFFNDVLGFLGAVGFWPLSVYFPIEMYIIQKKIPKWSGKWICVELINVVCLIVSVVAAVGSITNIVLDLEKYKLFSSNY